MMEEKKYVCFNQIFEVENWELPFSLEILNLSNNTIN